MGSFFLYGSNFRQLVDECDEFAGDIRYVAVFGHDDAEPPRECLGQGDGFEGAVLYAVADQLGHQRDAEVFLDHADDEIPL